MVASLPRDPSAFIAENCPVVEFAELGGLLLHQAVPESGVWRLAGNGFPPYWAWCWGGGLALAQHLVTHPERVAGKRVFDLGTGSGLVAILAAKAGAAHVIACDSDPNAIAAAGLNAALNGVTLDLVRADPLAGPPPDVDLIVVGDVFYDAGLALRVLAWLDRCAAAGIDIVIGDPDRETLPRDRLVEIARTSVVDFGDDTPRSAGVYRLAPGDNSAPCLEPPDAPRSARS